MEVSAVAAQRNASYSLKPLHSAAYDARWKPWRLDLARLP